MSLTTADLLFLLSGGANNTNPDNSLGGVVSAQPIVAGRLFNNLSDAQIAAGFTDYRCIYLKNISSIDVASSCQLSVSGEKTGESMTSLGFVFNDDIQQISINHFSTGSFTLGYGILPFSIDYDSDPNLIASTITGALLTAPDVTVVTVGVELVTLGSPGYSQLILNVHFNDTNGQRNHELIQMVDNTSDASVSFLKLQDGGPINFTSDQIDVATTPPTNISFFAPTSPIMIGDVLPLDFVPIWIQRVVPPNTPQLSGDGFTLGLTCNVA